MSYIQHGNDRKLNVFALSYGFSSRGGHVTGWGPKRLTLVNNKNYLVAIVLKYRYVIVF